MRLKLKAIEFEEVMDLSGEEEDDRHAAMALDAHQYNEQLESRRGLWNFIL